MSFMGSQLRIHTHKRVTMQTLPENHVCTSQVAAKGNRTVVAQLCDYVATETAVRDGTPTVEIQLERDALEFKLSHV